MKRFLILAVALVLLVTGCQSKSTKSSGSEEKGKKRIALVLPEKIGVNPFFSKWMREQNELGRSITLM